MHSPNQHSPWYAYHGNNQTKPNQTKPNQTMTYILIIIVLFASWIIPFVFALPLALLTGIITGQWMGVAVFLALTLVTDIIQSTTQP